MSKKRYFYHKQYVLIQVAGQILVFVHRGRKIDALVDVLKALELIMRKSEQKLKSYFNVRIFIREHRPPVKMLLDFC